MAIAIGDGGCDPVALEAPAGLITFEIDNVAGDAGEFEILAGDRVLDETENILPGIVVELRVRLDAGSYDLICYRTRLVHGTLNVSGGTAATAPPSTVVDPAVLDGCVATYHQWVQDQAAGLVSAVDQLVAAITTGDLEAARAMYPKVRQPWERIEPVAESFADLDTAIDAREEDFALGVHNPAFTGFHRLERLLWVDGASGDAGALAAGLAANVRELQARLVDLPIEARLMARGAGELIEEVAQSKLTGEEDRYSSTDLWSIDANFDGSRVLVDLFRPSLQTLDPTGLAAIDAAFASVDEVLAKYADGDGFQPFSAVTPDDLIALRARSAGLAEALATLPDVLGLAA